LEGRRGEDFGGRGEEKNSKLLITRNELTRNIFKT